MMMFIPLPRVVIPLCGGNIDTTVLGRCLERGLAADGRLVKFTVTVSDRPGGQWKTNKTCPFFIHVNFTLFSECLDFNIIYRFKVIIFRS